MEAFFLDNTQPLWNGNRTRLTLLLDPGRIKRDVGPNEELGPAILQGETYRLIIDSNVKDSRGNSLADNFAHSFTVTAPVYAALSIEGLETSDIEVGTEDPLRVSFPQVMNFFQLQRLLAVTTPAGEPVRGDIGPADQPHSILFTPRSPWRDDRYTLQISSNVEDISGNTFLAAFDQPAGAEPVKDSGAVQVKELTVVRPR